jgi:hypothetical protein
MYELQQTKVGLIRIGALMGRFFLRRQYKSRAWGSVLADSIVKVSALRTGDTATATAARHLNSSNIRSTARETSITSWWSQNLFSKYENQNLATSYV